MKRGERPNVQWGHVSLILLAIALAGYVGNGEITGQERNSWHLAQYS